MNTILQKRIEEAAENHEQFYNVGEEHGYLYTHKGDIKEAVIYGADFALQNQWISVEEALPEEDIPNCFVAYKTSDMVFYSTGSYEKDNDEWYVDGVGFNAEVTHWMMIHTINNEEKSDKE